MGVAIGILAFTCVFIMFGNINTIKNSIWSYLLIKELSKILYNKIASMILI